MTLRTFFCAIMKINLISLEGFRGIQKALQIPCGSGFTVICGPNGTGKSTICNSFEFALRGELQIRDGTERGEDISDYLWWRGKGAEKDRSVTIEFVDSNGGTFSVTRSGSRDPNSSSVGRLVDSKSAPQDWLAQLSLTTCIRDEAITILSTDRPERERYEFVLQAIGLTSSVAVETKIKELINSLRPLNENAAAAYENARRSVESLTLKLSEARASAVRATEASIARIRRHYTEQFNHPSPDLTVLTGVIAQQISRQRERISALQALLDAKNELDSRFSQIQADDYQKRIADLRSTFELHETKFKEVSKQYNDFQQALQEEQAGSPLLTSLALLREHGSRIGLRDGGCPLCGSQISPDDFEAHLSNIENEVRQANENIASIATAVSETKLELDHARREYEQAKRNYEESQSRNEALFRRRTSVVSQASNLGIELNDEKISLIIKKDSEQLSVLSEDLTIVEAYASIHQLSELEEQLKDVRHKAEQSDQQRSRLAEKVDLATKIQAAANRVSREIVDERLAALQPLFAELYERLRPHIDWPEIQFLLRGDVRPFLSFMVGEGLNPRFIFSSGQRRALGLAFLIAVHLSRTWCKLETLILDDAVQHVDDYRALHLVETLAALRMSGRQLICTVEDPALADLLCRRLRSGYGSEGVRIDLDYVPGEGAHIKRIEYVEPLPTGLLAVS
jgi:chromosome segregation protein